MSEGEIIQVFLIQLEFEGFVFCAKAMINEAQRYYCVKGLRNGFTVIGIMSIGVCLAGV